MPRAVAEETSNSRRLVIGTAIVEGAPDLAVATTVLAGARRALDEDVPALGGRPRTLVRETEGRARGERWLADMELEGTPGDATDSFLDLDVLRRELGLAKILGGAPLTK